MLELGTAPNPSLATESEHNYTALLVPAFIQLKLTAALQPIKLDQISGPDDDQPVLIC